MRVGLGAAGVDDDVLWCAGVAGGRLEAGTLSAEAVEGPAVLLEAAGGGTKSGSAIVWLMCEACSS